MPTSTTRAVAPKPTKTIENITRAPITAPHCLLVQLTIFPPLSLRCSSLHRDLNVLYGYLLLLEHPPDVLLSAGRELGEIMPPWDQDIERHVVAAILRSQVAGGG